MDTDACNVQGELAALILPVSASSVHLAREWIGLIWEAHALPATENAQLCISELTSNVHKHVTNGRSMQLVIHSYEDRVRGEVHDESTTMPELDETLPDLTEDDEGNLVVDKISESGNGMFLVKALSDDCGWHRSSTGKVVWFSLNASRR